MDFLLLAGIAFFLMSLMSSSTASLADPAIPAPGSVEDLARDAASSAEIPAWLLLSTGQVESGLRHLSPRGSGEGRTFYPYGIQRNRGRDIFGRFYGRPPDDQDELDAALGDLEINTQFAAAELARGVERYGLDPDRLRLFWVWPAAARSGPPYAEQYGSVPTARRLANWHAAIDQWQAVA